jgi:methyl-accepting chemotaxis protein
MNKSFIFKIIGIVVIAQVISCIVTLTIYSRLSGEFRSCVIKNANEFYMDGREDMLKSTTEIGAAVIKNIYALQGKSNEEKLMLAREIIRPVKFSKDGYYFVYEAGTGINKIHGSNKSLEDKNLWNMTNPINREYTIRELDKVAKENKMFYTYQWTKPGSDREFKKLGTAMSIDGSNMWIGTGVYLDEMDKEESELNKKATGVINKTRSYLIFGLLSFIVIPALTVGIIWLIYRKEEKNAAA